MKSTWFNDKRGYELMKVILDGHSEHRSQTVFRDFIRCVSLTLLQRAYQQAGHFCEVTEKEVLEIQRRYPKWAKTFAPGFAMLYETYMEIVKSGEFKDFIGSVYEEMGASSSWHGQFFTPMPICRVMAHMTLGTKEQFEEDYMRNPRRVRISEPACGAGATMLGVWELLQKWGVPASAVYFQGIDLDPMCVDMCYIQCSFYGMPATIYNANTLSNPTCEGAPAYTTFAGRIFPVREQHQGIQVHVANPPFGGKIDVNDLHYTLGGKKGLEEAKAKLALNPDSKIILSSASARSAPVQTSGKTPPTHRSAIRDR